MAENRVPRELETRERATRKRAWVQPDVLPSPNPEPGYDFHWVRISTRGQADPMNVSLKLREGWEPVKAVEHPEVHVANIEDERFKDNIVIGGLMLCRAPKELVEERTSHYQAQNEAQIQSVDHNFMRQNDPRMPLYVERKSRVTFGRGQ